MVHNIGCVIISNSDDLKFLYANIKQTHHIFKHIVIAIGSKLWNGEKENHEKIAEFETYVATHHPNITIKRYNVPEDKIPFMENMVRPSMYWEAHARWISLEVLHKDCEYVMFLDSDEVVDGDAFESWVKSGMHKAYDAMKLANYWYWRDVRYRAKDYIEDSVVFIRRDAFNPMMLFSNLGRQGAFDGAKTNRKGRCVKGLDDTVMIHHYSWVRDRDAMLRKVKNWGHRDDRQDWTDLIETEFSKPFSGRDFLKGHEYDVVPNVFEIDV